MGTNLTVDTITDEQIIALRDEAVNRLDRNVDTVDDRKRVVLCNIALRGTTSIQRIEARARIVEILNALAKETK